MSVKRDRTKQNKQRKTHQSLRKALKDSKHQNGKPQITVDCTKSKSSKLNQIISDKIDTNHKHNKRHLPKIQRRNTNTEAKENWECSKCTFINSSLMKYCEICETEKNGPNNVDNKENKDCDGDIAMNDEELIQQQQLSDSKLAEKLQREFKQNENEKKEKELLDEKMAKELQQKLSKTDNGNSNDIDGNENGNDKMIAMRLQIEHERELLELEREKIENEKAAILIQAKEDAQNAKYLQLQRKDAQMAIKLQNEMKMEMEMEMNEQKVRDMFQESLRPSRTIISIEEICNKDKEEIYEKIMEEKLKNNTNKTRETIEQYVWHGTKNLNNLQLIIKNGFDRSYNTASAYGKGTYFAKDASYSVGGYCGKDNKGIYQILLCKIIVGDCTVGSSQIKAIPKKANGNEYDSLVNCLNNPSIFVIWRDYHACPKYLVKFK